MSASGRFSLGLLWAGSNHHKGCYYAFRHEVVSSLTRDSDHLFSDVTGRQLNGLVFLDVRHCQHRDTLSNSSVKLIVWLVCGTYSVITRRHIPWLSRLKHKTHMMSFSHHHFVVCQFVFITLLWFFLPSYVDKRLEKIGRVRSERWFRTVLTQYDETLSEH